MRLVWGMFVCAVVGSAQQEWRTYGGNPAGTRYSTLSQINRKNVSKLQVAWTFDTGDAFKGSEMQCQPIIVRGVLYATTPKLRVIALDATSGKLRWSFDPNPPDRTIGKGRNRGVTYWESGKDQRIFFVYRNLLHALDAVTGKPIESFGKKGMVDLRQDLGRDVGIQNITAATPGVIYKDLLIMGSLVSEGLPSPPGHIRAYDVRTGKLRWIFHTIPHPGEYGYESWPKDAWTYSSGTNNWAGMALDEKRGIVYAPTGSAAFDFYGANRAGDNLFANTLLALDAATGKRIWHFQAVRHDLWDRDFPSPPTLVTVHRNGRVIDAVAQTTKAGLTWVFNRETGDPVFPIEYRNVPKSDIPGEVTAEKQPFPLKPPPYARQEFTEDLITNRTPEAHAAVLETWRKVRKGAFQPPSREGSILFPGMDGGAEWGGSAYDPGSGLLYVNASEMAWIIRLVERPGKATTAKKLYLEKCGACHGPAMKGAPPEFPSLVGIASRHTDQEIRRVIRLGNGRMPGFADLDGEHVNALMGFITKGVDREVAASAESEILNPRFRFEGYKRWLDPDGYPAVKPPWGTLNAIDLNKGEIKWRIPFGEYPELVEKMGVTGAENYGGPVVTDGGLLFIGATALDRKFRAYDKETGELLWQTVLPAGGNATPATYEVDGRQYVVIAAGGGKSGAPSGGSYVAFALPK